MTRRRIAGTMLGVLVAAAAVAPALGAFGTVGRLSSFDRTIKATTIASFTPASADPRLAALLARTGVGKSAYRFTPSETARVGSRAVTVAVRAQSALGKITTVDVDPADPLAPSIQIAPIAYNLGTSVGWKRFASSGDLAALDLSGARDRIDATLARRPAAHGPERAVAGPSRLVVDDGLIDAGSFSLSRNLDLTAGSRKVDNNRLDRLPSNRRDSQAVYIGTALRF